MNWELYPAAANFKQINHFEGKIEKSAVVLESRQGAARFELAGEGIARVSFTPAPERTHSKRYSRAGLTLQPPEHVELGVYGASATLRDGQTQLCVLMNSGEFSFCQGGETFLCGEEFPFGVCGSQSLVSFLGERGAPVYGLGEKTGGLDKSGRSWRFWTVDVIACHPGTSAGNSFDPTYVSIPFFVTRIEDEFFGVYLDNPHSTFLHAGISRKDARWFHPSHGFREGQDDCLAFGADEGPLDMYLLAGPTLADVSMRLSSLLGRHELPPLWALGYHQCRWSYASLNELLEVAGRLQRARIPVSALWLDIDHMDQYKVFTWNPERFADAARAAAFQKLRDQGIRLVAIVDPGVKAEPGYAVFKDGMKKDVFCKTPEGEPYYGVVWPGKTVFPDFSLERARDWWAGWIQRFLSGENAANQNAGAAGKKSGGGLDGIWIDMNDPHAGQVDLEAMRFEGGRAPHSAYHNQYAHLMAQATFEGIERADARKRPFILTRSACAGTQKYAAVWTGDNFSNETHMAMSIPMCLNLSLSGVSFTGPDVGGFAGDASEELFVAWNLAGALFPFLRNHSSLHTRQQEPYAYSARALRTVRKCINTRLKLLPYIYTQFAIHSTQGGAVMRPVAYEFPGAEYERISDQFLIGPSLMAAPFTDCSSARRQIILPPGWWFSLHEGRWVRGGRSVQVERKSEMILYVRDGSILPCLEGVDFFPAPDMRKVSFHVFAKSGGAEGMLYEDDGETRDHQKGVCNWIRAEAFRRRRAMGITARRAMGITARREVFGFENGSREAAAYFYGATPAGARRVKVQWPFAAYSAAALRIPIEFC